MLDHREIAGSVSDAHDASLPEFSVRVSTRARRIRLTVTPRDGLVVVVPRGWRGDPGAIVASKLSWARRALASVADRRAQLLAGHEALLPSEVSLPALGRTLSVEYLQTAASGVSARVRGASVVVSGDVDDAEACCVALRRWLTRLAQCELPTLLSEEVERTGLRPTRVRITSARTRWGSCSARGTVSLNRNALFLPEDLARSLVLHELAHLKVMDHSPRFWGLLATLDPQALEHRAQLKHATDLVPAWADA